MNLDEAQKKVVAGWVAQGLKLSEIQSRLASDLGLKLTYMEVRFLVDDLKLVPKDIEPPKAPATLGNSAPSATAKAAPPASPVEPLEPEPELPGGNVSVVVDQLTRPGALVSGKVTFSDGNKASWYLDQSGRLGLASEKQGYRPAPEDIKDFQMALEAELAKLGF